MNEIGKFIRFFINIFIYTLTKKLLTNKKMYDILKIDRKNKEERNANYNEK